MTVSNHNKTNTTKLCKCKVIGVAAYADIAVLAFENNQPAVGTHTTLSWATTEVAIGDICLLLGNPLGIDETSLAAGNVRDNKYTLSNIIESVAIDAITFTGNSGSPVTNWKGEVISILCAGIGDFEGFSWGASARVLKQSIENIIQTNGNYVCGTLGVPLRYIQIPDALQLGIDLLDGFIVGASQNNLLAGDVILELDGKIVGHDKDTVTMSVFFKKGTTLNAKILRNKQIIWVNVYVSELSLQDDVPLGTFNHKIKKHVIE